MLNDAAIWKSLTTPSRLFLIAGPCVIESESLCLKVAAAMKKTCDRLGLAYVFKASFDKANLSSAITYPAFTNKKTSPQFTLKLQIPSCGA